MVAERGSTPAPVPGLRLRAAVATDAELLLELIRELAGFERLSHAVVADAAALRRHLFGDRPAAEALVAEVDGAPAGFALYFPTFSTFVGKPGLYLEDLFIRPAFRGRGIGRAVLAHLARLAVERGCGRLEWSVLDWNERAIGFYRKLGARAMGDWTVYRIDGEPLDALAKGGAEPEPARRLDNARGV
jgi:GNAT superfamily N-acetyltransferase